MSTPPLLPLNNKSDSSPFQNLKPSILLILLIISFTFLLSLSLCLLLRHLNRRCLGHLSSASHPAAAISSSNRVSPALSIVDSLPLFTFSSIKRRSTNSSGDCAVCLSKFEQQDQLRLLPLCCHAFHVHCIDTWLHSNQTCPLCRSPIYTSESDLLMATTADGADATSFRLEIGSISHRQTEPRSSYSVGSFEYVVDEESEIAVSQTHGRSVSDKEIGAQSTQEASTSWLKDYFDRLSASLSSRASSFRSSGRFFTGSSRRADIGEYDAEANRVGEEISEMFRWFSGV